MALADLDQFWTASLSEVKIQRRFAADLPGSELLRNGVYSTVLARWHVQEGAFAQITMNSGRQQPVTVAHG